MRLRYPVVPCICILEMDYTIFDHKEVRPDCFEIKVEEGDVILLCSDGLTNMIEDTVIESTIKEYKEDMKLAGESLVKQANEAGGKDNISVILVRL